MDFNSILGKEMHCSCGRLHSTDLKSIDIGRGALDRLHYEKDPCVKYDIGRKLWIYLHRDRSEEEFGMCPASPGRPDVLSRPHPSPPWHSLRTPLCRGRSPGSQRDRPPS